MVSIYTYIYSVILIGALTITKSKLFILDSNGRVGVCIIVRWPSFGSKYNVRVRVSTCVRADVCASGDGRSPVSAAVCVAGSY